MTSKHISSIHFTDEQQLWDYYNLCGLSPALRFESAKDFNYTKTTYCIEDMFLCKTHSLSGWGFEKQHNTDVYFISYTHSGLSEWEMNKIGHVHAAKQLCIIDSARLVQGQFAAGTTTDTIMIDSHIIHRELTAYLGFQGAQRIDFQPVLPSDSKAWNTINSIAFAISTAINADVILSSPIGVSYLKQALLSTIIETIPHNVPLNHEKNNDIPRYLSKAIDYIHANIRNPILLSDIAENSHTSIRNLQLGFSKYQDTTPLRYLRKIRLTKARADLLSLDVSSSWHEVAISWGFTDLNAFSRYYHKMYGETPFQTTYKAKGLILQPHKGFMRD